MHRARPLALIAVACAATLGVLGPGPAYAFGNPAASEESTREKGVPTVVLDHLELPAVEHASVYERHLRQVLRREARRADWGAGRGRRIEYRFFVDRLVLSQEQGVLKVECSALGRLPKGKSARSQLSYGGDPKKPRDVVFKVLEIVARGVITRLAELERARRAEAR